MPPYRLETLLEMRARAKEEAEQAFSAAIKALEKEKAELKRLEEDLARRKAERKAKVMAYLNEVMAKGAGVNGMNMMGRFEQRLKDEEAQVALDIERQREAVKVAERTVEQRRAQMAEAAKELKAIEKHKENWQKQIKHERQQREELTQEEIGSALFLARQRK
jgi:flagellar export protein FliJ